MNAKKLLSAELYAVVTTLDRVVGAIPVTLRDQQCIQGTGGMISPADLISYQIGWGTLLLNWYTTGLAGALPEMPGDGFTRWDYTGLAKHFYQKYAHISYEQKIVLFNRVATDIIAVAQQEEQRDRINQLGIWEWCTLASGKKWPLGKWIRVNTVAPYKRMITVLRRLLKEI